MPFAGRSHLLFIGLAGVWIIVVFVGIALFTKASRRLVAAALVASLAAGAINLLLDVVAYRAGWWAYPEATTPFGPLLYYLEAGLGCGAIALGAIALKRRYGLVAPIALLAVFTVYGPIRDYATARFTGLIEFHYSPIVVVADALFEFTIPVLIAWASTRYIGAGE